MVCSGSVEVVDTVAVHSRSVKIVAVVLSGPVDVAPARQA